MKCLNPIYWFKLLVLITPIFNNQWKIINSKSTNKENIKNWDNNICNLNSSSIQPNYKEITCIHEAGHTITILNSKFKNKFEKMEFFPTNPKYYGATTSTLNILPVTIVNTSTNNKSITNINTSSTTNTNY